MPSADFSPVAVTFQCIGALLLAMMMGHLGRIFSSEYARRWATGWGALFLSLICVRIYLGTAASIWWIGYLLAQWTFLFLLYDGCRLMVDRSGVDRRHAVYGIPIAVALAMIATHFSSSFNDLFIGQAAVVALASMFCFRVLTRVPIEDRTAGWQTLRAGLSLMVLLYASYIPLYWIHSRHFPLPFLTFASLADFMAAVLLGFSMILVTADDAKVALNEALGAQKSAQASLEQQLHIDPLTEALNRHAFYWMQRGEEITTVGVLSGVVIVLDIDNLKRINDEHGHAVGDHMIRSAANAIRARVRADDLIFRWGGDEFVAVLPNLPLDVVQARFRSVSDGVRTPIPGHPGDLQLFLSWGAAEFGSVRTLEDAMALADAEMYEKRFSRRSAAIS